MKNLFRLIIIVLSSVILVSCSNENTINKETTNTTNTTTEIDLNIEETENIAGESASKPIQIGLNETVSNNISAIMLTDVKVFPTESKTQPYALRVTYDVKNLSDKEMLSAFYVLMVGGQQGYGVVEKADDASISYAINADKALQIMKTQKPNETARGVQRELGIADINQPYIVMLALPSEKSITEGKVDFEEQPYGLYIPNLKQLIVK